MNRSSPFSSLVALSNRLEVAPTGFRPQNVSFMVTIYPDGRPPKINDLRDLQGKRAVPIVFDLPTYDTSRPGGKVQPGFLWDNAKYALGIDESWQEDGKSENATIVKWEAFKYLHLSNMAGLPDSGVTEFCKFLEDWNAAQHLSMLQEINARDLLTGNIIFEVYGMGRIHDMPVCRKAWERIYAETQTELAKGFCPIAGTVSSLVREHNPIKKIRGAQPTAKLVSYNEKVFESYGLKRNANGAMGVAAVDQYGKALNVLTASDRHSLNLGPNRKVLFWVEGGDPDAYEPMFRELIDPRSEQDRTQRPVTAWRDAAHGLIRGNVSPEEFRERLETDLHLGSAVLCILTLSGESGRIALRDWDHSMLSDKLDAFVQHREDCWIEPNRFNTQPPGVYRLLRCAQSENLDSADIKDPYVVNLVNEMLQAMLTPTRPYPQGLAAAVLRAIRGDHSVTDHRCALLRGTLNRQLRLMKLEGKPAPMSLNLENTDIAYVLGRLFAIVERAQEQALNNPNNTIRDSFFTSASSAPASIFPVLLHKSQHHLAQIRKESRPTYIYLEKMVGDAIDKLPPVLPSTLSLQKQGTFVIGYYHQRQSFFKKKENLQANSDTEVNND